MTWCLPTGRRSAERRNHEHRNRFPWLSCARGRSRCCLRNEVCHLKVGGRRAHAVRIILADERGWCRMSGRSSSPCSGEGPARRMGRPTWDWPCKLISDGSGPLRSLWHSSVLLVKDVCDRRAGQRNAVSASRDWMPRNSMATPSWKWRTTRPRMVLPRMTAEPIGGRTSRSTAAPESERSMMRQG